MFKFLAILVIILCLRENRGHVLKGTTIQSPPFNTELKGLLNGILKGFSNDLIKEIDALGTFDIKLDFTPDGRYGNVNNTRNGVIDEIHSGRVDFAVTDKTANDSRTEFVDFTEPFIETGIVILIHKNNVNNINSFHDLAEQTDTKYGAVFMGLIYYELSQSTDPTLSRIYRNMINNTNIPVMNLMDGLERVKTTNYAFIVEKTFAEYITGINCDLTFIEDNNISLPLQFAIALNKGSNYTQVFNSAIRKLKEKGEIALLRNRYWKKCVNGVTIVSPPYIELSDGKLDGFVMDLIKEISEYTGHELKINLTPDGMYGRIQNDSVNGMIGEVHYNRADFAIADLTVTDARKQFVDFTEPFMETGLAILIHKNNANNISSLQDLANQTVIQYGWVFGGSTNAFFSQSNDTTIKRMYQHVQSNPSNYLRRVIEGVPKVKGYPYAMIAEKPFAEVIAGKDCDLTYIPISLNLVTIHYAIAVAENSQYLEQFNSAIRRKKSDGVIDILRNRYWKKCGVLSGVTLESGHMANIVFGKLEGFGVELMDHLSRLGGFNYSLYFAPANKIDGMLDELNNYRADFGIADTAITDKRKQSVDFTEPFIETEIVILIHKDNANNITSFADLSQQTDIKYGTTRHGSTIHFLQQSTDPTFQEIYRQMAENPEVLVSNMKVGIEKVKTTPFALIIPKMSAKFIIGYNCDLKYIEDQNNTLHLQYAIALQKGSPYLETFNSGIRSLKSDGVIQNLMERRWYSRKCGDSILNGVSILFDPYTTISKTTGKLTGFTVDLMNEISPLISLNYTLGIVRGNIYGTIVNNRANGLIDEVSRKWVDFGIADLTVTEERRKFVDFTEPFMEFRIVILINKDNAINITSFRDLVNQTDIKYGVVKNGATYNYFKESTDPTISQMFKTMTENPELLVSNMWSGVEKVNSSRFAYIGEQTSIEYMIGQNCQFTSIVEPDPPIPRQYAIALPKNSTHIQAFNSAISQLKANGVIDRIRRKYWKKCQENEIINS